MVEQVETVRRGGPRRRRWLGVSLVADDRLTFATAVPESVAALEQAQADSQQGPCVHACRTGEVVAVKDLAEVSDLTRDWVVYRAMA